MRFRDPTVKRWKLLAIGIALAALAAVATMPLLRPSRGVRVLPLVDAEAPRDFDPAQSAALFVGVSHFTSGKGMDVPFAVDDAVDLAYMFTFDSRAGTIPFDRVVLVLSGEPRNPQSKQWLEELRRARVKIIQNATTRTIQEYLQKQADVAGPNGVLIVSVASHGFMDEGVPYVLGSSSRLHDPRGSLAVTEIADVAEESKAQRSLLLIDACRDRYVEGTRGSTGGDPADASFYNRMERAQGQAILSAVGIAYDDFKTQNGGFTRFVLEGLECNAARTRGVVTAENLAPYVERNLLRWIRENRNPRVRTASVATIEGSAGNMPLARCEGPLLGPVVRASIDGTSVLALGHDGKQLWSHDLGTKVAQTDTFDIDGDRHREILTLAGNRLTVLDDRNKPLWPFDADTPLRAFAVGPEYHKATSQIAVLSATRITLLDSNGAVVAQREHHGEFKHIAFGRRSSLNVSQVVAATEHEILFFEAKKLAKRDPAATVRSPDSIVSIAVGDHDGDGKDEIRVTTRGGVRFLEFARRK